MDWELVWTLINWGTELEIRINIDWLFCLTKEAFSPSQQKEICLGHFYNVIGNVIGN